MSENKEKTYIVRDNGRNKLTGTKEWLQGAIVNLSLPYRWSESEEDFIAIEDMHPKHLLNSIKEEFALVDSDDELLQVMNSPMMVEFLTRKGAVTQEE